MRTNSERRRQQIVTHFSKLYSDEKTHINKFKWLSRTLAIVGWLILFAVVLESRLNYLHLPIWLLLILAFTSGILFSFHVWYKENLLQWPFFKEFLHHEKIEKAAKKHK